MDNNNRSKYTRQIIIIISTLVIFLTIPAIVSGDCPAKHIESETKEENKNEALKLKAIAIASVLAAGTIGVSFPLIGRKLQVLRPEHDVFFMIKAFAAGVILATGFIHILPDAFRSLTSPCLARTPWREFPFTGFIAMAASIGTLMVDTLATALCKDGVHSHGHGAKQTDDGGSLEETAGNIGHENDGRRPHGLLLEARSPDLLRQRIISQVLEVGIVVHSVIIGISLGASMSPNTIRPLIVALSFHQFFEGMGLGGCISQARFKSLTTTVMTLFFSLTTPIGIGIGMGISSVYKKNSTKAIIVEGVMNSASSGILIYMALVDILAADFMNPRLQNNVRLQLGAHATLLLGAGCTSLIAKWA